MATTPDIFKSKPRKIRNTPIWTGIKEDTKFPAEWNQAEKILAKLGGPDAASKLLDLNKSSIYRWMDSRWSNGIIPNKQAARIKRIARREGIVLTAKDWEPEYRLIKKEEDEL